jgi:hypothetical protein
MVELTKRYIVMAMASEAPFDVSDPEGIFVLKPWKDPAALRALEAYRDNCYPELARDLDAWIAAIKNGPVIRGGIGTRNAPYLKAATPAAGAGRRAAASAARRAPARSARPRAARRTARTPTPAAKKAAGKTVKKAARKRR